MLGFYSNKQNKVHGLSEDYCFCRCNMHWNANKTFTELSTGKLLLAHAKCFTDFLYWIFHWLSRSNNLIRLLSSSKCIDTELKHLYRAAVASKHRVCVILKRLFLRSCDSTEHTKHSFMSRWSEFFEYPTLNSMNPVRMLFMNHKWPISYNTNVICTSQRLT